MQSDVDSRLSPKRRRVEREGEERREEEEDGKEGVRAAVVERAPLFHSGVRIDYALHPPDFDALALEDPTFAAAVRGGRSGGRRRGRGGARTATPPSPPPTSASSPSSSSSLPSSSPSVSVDWCDPSVLLAVTRALLWKDFGLSFELPLQHLCPPVPQRLSYLYFVADLMEEDAAQRHRGRRGVDIGCGASAIFPLLGATAFGYQFIATGHRTPAVTGSSPTPKRHRTTCAHPLIVGLRMRVRGVDAQRWTPPLCQSLVRTSRPIVCSPWSLPYAAPSDATAAAAAASSVLRAVHAAHIPGCPCPCVIM